MVSTDDDVTVRVAHAHDPGPRERDFYYYYGTLVYPLSEHESPQRIYADADAMCATARY